MSTIILKNIRAAVEILLMKIRKQTTPETPVTHQNAFFISSSVFCDLDNIREANMISTILASSEG
jgi:hypothetical protein